MMIFAVGPSRAGKTTLIRAVLNEVSGVRLLELDAEDNQSAEAIRAAGCDPGGWEERWRRNLECIRREEAIGGNVIVDVGAGSLQTAEGRHFFIARKDTMIAVTPPWQVVHRRHKGPNANEFKQTEYSADRRKFIARLLSKCPPQARSIDLPRNSTAHCENY